MSFEVKRRELYFFHQPGCAACEAARPVVDAWMSKHYAEVIVVPIDLTMYDGDKYGFTPKATPAYLYAENGEAVRDHTGVLPRSRDLDEMVRSP